MAQEDFTVFILGVAGYVGGSLLTRLVKQYPNARFVGFVRSESAIPVIRAAGCQEVIQGTNADFEKIRNTASQADLVLNIADCDDVGLTTATLEGLKLRYQTTGRRPVLIHTSGTALIMDPKAQGKFDPDYAAHPYDDGVEEHIKTRIAPESPHRNVDNLVFSADEEGYIDGHIVAPAVVYGPSSGPLVRESRGPIPRFVDMALSANQGIKVGEGTATWYNIHIGDLLDFYELLIKKVLIPETEAERPSSYSKFYFMVSEAFQWGELSEIVAKALHERGALPTPEVKSLSVEEAKEFFSGASGLGSNMFCVATKAKELGWRPKHLQWKQDAVADVELRLKTLGKL